MLTLVTSRIDFGIIIEMISNKIYLNSIKVILETVNYTISQSNFFRTNLPVNKILN